MLIFLLFGRSEAIVHGALNVTKHNSEDSDGFSSAEFRNYRSIASRILSPVMRPPQMPRPLKQEVSSLVPPFKEF